MTLRYFAFAAMLFALLGFAPAAAEPTNGAMQADDVPLIALIVDPARYNGAHIRTIGYLNLEFEGNGLYASKADFNAAVLGNRVWIETPSWVDQAAADRLSRKYALVEGIFQSTRHGHLGGFRGTITSIIRLETWGPRQSFAFGTPQIERAAALAVLVAMVSGIAAGLLAAWRVSRSRP